VYALQDYAHAIALLVPLADRGNVVAQMQLGLIYARGQGVLWQLQEPRPKEPVRSDRTLSDSRNLAVNLPRSQRRRWGRRQLFSERRFLDCLDGFCRATPSQKLQCLRFEYNGMALKMRATGLGSPVDERLTDFTS
jgi:hypothetical protein